MSRRKEERKRRFVRRMASELKRRLPLRLHMTAIFIAVVAFGVVISRLLLAAGIEARSLRWSLGVLVSYPFFLLCVRFWLDRLHSAIRPQAMEAVLEGVHAAVDFAPSVADVTFGGGGTDVVAAPMRSARRATSFAGSGKPKGSSGGLDVPSVDSEGAAVLAIVVLVCSLLVAATILIVQAPAILGEAGAEALLAVSLRRRLRYTPATEWLGGVVKRTILVAVAVLVIAAIAGAIVDASEAKKHESTASRSMTVPGGPVSPSR